MNKGRNAKTDFKNKSVIITGAGTGVGKALSLELASRGAIVYVTALTEKEAQNVANQIVSTGQKAIGVKVDVSINDDLQSIIDRVIAEQGKLDLIINNAGVAYVGEFYDMEESFISKLIAINLTAVIVGSLYAYRQMKKQGFGQILNISSMGGYVPAATMAVYAGTKHGVLGFTNTLGTEAKDFGIRVNAACLGNVQSEMLSKAEDIHEGAEAFGAALPKPYPTEKAARKIIDSLAKNKRIIFTPFYASVVWRLARLFPSLVIKGSVETMRKYRRLMKTL